MRLPYKFVCLASAIWVASLSLMASAADVQKDANVQLFDQATQELVCFNFPVSYQLFDELVTAITPEHELYFKALLARGMSAQHITPPTQEKNRIAIADFISISKQCSDDPLLARSILNLGRIAEMRDYPNDKIDLKLARSYYQQVIDRWPDNVLGDEAMMWLAGTYIQIHNDKKSHQAGIDLLEKWLKAKPKNDYASAMWMYLGETYKYKIVSPQKAMACYIKADKLGLPVTAQASSIYWKMATLAQTLPGMLETSVYYYQKIIRVTPTSGRAFESQLALGDIAKENPKMKIQVPEIQLYEIGE